MQSHPKTVPVTKPSPDQKAKDQFAKRLSHLQQAKVMHTDTHLKTLEDDLAILFALEKQLKDHKCELLGKPNLLRVSTYEQKTIDGPEKKAIKDLLAKRIEVLRNIHLLYFLKLIIETKTAEKAARDIMLHNVDAKKAATDEQVEWMLKHEFMKADDYTHPELGVTLMVAKLFPKANFKYLEYTVEQLVAGKIDIHEIANLQHVRESLQEGFANQAYRKVILENFEHEIRKQEFQYSILKRKSSGYLPLMRSEANKDVKDNRLTKLILNETHNQHKHFLIETIVENARQLDAKDSKLLEGYKTAMTAYVNRVAPPHFDHLKSPHLETNGFTDKVFYENTKREFKLLLEGAKVIQNIRNHYKKYKAKHDKGVSTTKDDLLNQLEDNYCTWMRKLSPKHSANEILEKHIIPLLESVETGDHFQATFKEAILAMKAVLPPRVETSVNLANK